MKREYYPSLPHQAQKLLFYNSKIYIQAQERTAKKLGLICIHTKLC